MTTIPNAARLNGLAPDKERRSLAHAAEREAMVMRERLAIAARWAAEHGRPCAFDSKGWPLDENDQPLHHGSCCSAETLAAYRRAMTMAKARRSRRAPASRRAEVFDITTLDLSGIRPSPVARLPRLPIPW